MFGKGFEQVRPEERQGVINMYDGEIRYADELIGEIFEDLKNSGLLKRTYIIITSDHGEGFWEHGFWEHGKSFYNEEIQIPLVIYPPGGRQKEPQKIGVPLSNIDLFPTIVAFAGAQNPEGIEGKSLSRFFSSNPFSISKGNDMLFSESPHSFDIEASAVIRGRTKYIHTPQKPERDHLLFDLEADPSERNNLAQARTDLISNLYKTLQQHKAINEAKRQTLDVQSLQLNKETIEGLRSLGYLQ